MKSLSRLVPITIMVLIWSFATSLVAQTSEKAKPRKYVGVGKCQTCHKREKYGNQYQKWATGPHARAYQTLATEKAKTYAQKKGINDPQKAEACLKCHVTAYNAPAELLGTKYKIEDGVGCESCHGAGGDYYKLKTMKAITAGEIDRASVGLIKPDEETCVKCHNSESPGFKGFDFKVASEKIAHPRPKK